MKRNQKKGFVFLTPVVAIGVTALLGGTFAAAQVSLPGNPLYGIKTATEKARVAVAFTESTKAKTHLSIASSKVREMELLGRKEVSLDKIKKAEEKFADHQNKAQGLIKNGETEKQKMNLIEESETNEVKNEEVLQNVYEKVPEPAKETIQRVIEKSRERRAGGKDKNIKNAQ